MELAMGMYFTTAATRLLLQTLNKRYDRSPEGLIVNGPLDKPKYQAPANTLLDIWTTFNVSLDIPATPQDPGSPNGVDNLAQLFKAYQTNNNGSTTTAQFIKDTMLSYLSDTSCNAIEFFAVPSTQIMAFAPASVDDEDNKGKHSCIIAVQTVTHDKAAAFVRRNRWVRPDR
jgi:hypothetical protein